VKQLHPLRFYLLTHDIKQNDFAKQIGITPPFLSHILKYKYFPSRKTAIKIIELTHNKISMNDLYCPEDTQNENIV
jgi:DNA-binding XRE family transcriptional regulator